jgi:nitroimidazol reductase NimA-like FMN-containing flavoprotein (pyridoxamine 5'-phosphate oxidase superfamily)
MMRRKEKEITDRLKINKILDEAQVCRMAFARDNEPYLVPLFFGYDGRCLYFHTAREGRKLDFLEANHRVCFEVERSVKLVPHDARACTWSAHYESVVGVGWVTELLGLEERQQGLNQIMRHYSGREWPIGPPDLNGVRVWCVEIESLTGKESK